jgi:hypothetical protein
MKVKKSPCRRGAGCADRDLSDHYAPNSCATPYCNGGSEVHCLRCGWYTSTCPCGCNNGQNPSSGAHARAMRRLASKRKEARR